MVKAAFHDDLTTDLPLPGLPYTQIEENFSLFWGLSVLLYGRTLIPNNTPYDKFREGKGTLTKEQQDGLALFTGSARCIQCHGGAEFTNASIQNGGNGSAFTNTGGRPTAEDPGQLPEATGKFKTPTLRNVDLTGPYFHNGGYLTLRQVIDFYDRGGDFNNPDKDSQVRKLGLTESQKKSLVSFMLALTDDRVRCEKAPFDHPSLTFADGSSIPAVGAGGGACLKPFLNADPFTPSSRPTRSGAAATCLLRTSLRLMAC
jgi:hypothetical protein